MGYYHDFIERQTLEETYAIQKAFAQDLKAKSQDYSPKIESKEANRSYQKMAAILDRPELEPLFRQCLQEEPDQKLAATTFVKKILESEGYTRAEKAELAIRGAAAVMTNGVVTVPLDGIPRIQIVSTAEGRGYLRLEFSGPIRAAGGTTMVTLVAIAAYVKERLDLQDFVPTTQEVERYVIELEAYTKIVPRDIVPSPQEVRLVVRSCPICIDGAPTQVEEVPLYRYLPRVATPRIRGGMSLVLIDGLIFRAKKAKGPLQRLGISWPWLDELVLMRKDFKRNKEDGEGDKDTNLTLGRPLLSLAGNRGGLRYRLAKGANNGLSAALLHPLVFQLVGFMNIGTQAKTYGNLPKGATLHACNDMAPPVVQYRDGIRIYQKGTRCQVLKVLELGQIGYAIGEHLQFAYPLLERDYCVQNWRARSGLKEPASELEALSLREPGLKLHPAYSLFLKHVSPGDYLWLRALLREGDLPATDRVKNILRELCAQCDWSGPRVSLRYPISFRYHFLLDEDVSAVDISQHQGGVLGYVNQVLQGRRKLPIGEKGLNYVNLRIGRAQAVAYSRLKPPINGVGVYTNPAKTTFWKAIPSKPRVRYQAGYRRCPGCQNYSTAVRCKCGARTDPVGWCALCKEAYGIDKIALLRYGVPPGEISCARGHKLQFTMQTFYDYGKKVKAMAEAGYPRIASPPRVTLYPGGSINFMEPFEKAYLRACHGLPVTRDGLSKLNMMNLTTTMFTPRDVRTTVERLKRMGYHEDRYGNPLTQETQEVALKPLDVIYPEDAFSLLKAELDFIDDLIRYYYGGPVGYYDARKVEDIIGLTAMFLAPHTSCAYACRIVGLARVNGFYRHPVAIAAGRRNLDGDGDAAAFLMNAFLNYSRAYARQGSGGLMGSPVILSNRIFMDQVDQEVLDVECEPCLPPHFLDNTRSYSAQEIRKYTHFYRNADFSQTYIHRTPGYVLQLDTLANSYKDLSSSLEKFTALLELQQLLLVDTTRYNEGILRGHLIRDCVGNANAFFRQSYLCGNCREQYTYPPLQQKCVLCHNGSVRMTVTRRMVTKYLDYINRLAKDPRLSEEVMFKIRQVRANLACFEDPPNPLRMVLKSK